MTKTVVSVLVVAAAAAVVIGAAAPAPPAIGATQITLYVPFTPNGLSIGLAVTRRVSGSCFTGSAASNGRSDAWRCNAGNAILDPCYQGFASGKTLACPDTPWSANVVLLTLTKELPQKDANKDTAPKGLPWALELANGMRCELLTGATFGVAGMRANYGCADSAYVVGDPDRSLPVWRVFFQGPRGFAVTQIGVRVAWY